MNTFDQRLPETTTYRMEKDIFYINNSKLILTVEEGDALTELFKYAALEATTKAVIVDNSQAKGVWKQDLSNLWMKNENAVRNKRMAVLTSNYTAAMQINRIARGNDLVDYIRGFNSGWNDEVEAFING